MVEAIDEREAEDLDDEDEMEWEMAQASRANVRPATVLSNDKVSMFDLPPSASADYPVSAPKTVQTYPNPRHASPALDLIRLSPSRILLRLPPVRSSYPRQTDRGSKAGA